MELAHHAAELTLCAELRSLDALLLAAALVIPAVLAVATSGHPFARAAPNRPRNGPVFELAFRAVTKPALSLRHERRLLLIGPHRRHLLGPALLPDGDAIAMTVTMNSIVAITLTSTGIPRWAAPKM